MLFGSFDASNAITVDKPPAALWIPELLARVIGVNSWSVLVPEALMGVATVALVVVMVRRWFSSGAALFAGVVMACTPVAALMFRFNNPDALLVLMLTAAAYAVVRALEDGRTRWMVLAGSLVGFGFLAKMMQAFVVIPALALVYLVAGPPQLGRRIRQIVAMGVATIVAGGWWVALVELWPSGSRPYIGGSQHNSVLELRFGYNGLGRLTGNETGSVGGGAATTTSRWGATGFLRLFNRDYGGQISWLLPASLVALVAGLLWTARRPRTDRTRAALILWGATLLLTGLTISLSQGIIHTYYTVALAPAVGAARPQPVVAAVAAPARGRDRRGGVAAHRRRWPAQGVGHGGGRHRRRDPLVGPGGLRPEHDQHAPHGFAAHGRSAGVERLRSRRGQRWRRRSRWDCWWVPRRHRHGHGGEPSAPHRYGRGAAYGGLRRHERSRRRWSGWPVERIHAECRTGDDAAGRRRHL